jgi:phosphatidylglycerophosphatase A
MRFVPLALATGCGVGYIPFAPGTFGSLLGLLLWWVVGPSFLGQAAAVTVVFAAGTFSAGVAERHFRATDPHPVVIDEVLGMLVTLFANPVGWRGALAGFFVFRLFDVIKPYPANRLEKLHGGFGVMADDAMAAVYANLTLRAILALGHLLA